MRRNSRRGRTSGGLAGLVAALLGLAGDPCHGDGDPPKGPVPAKGTQRALLIGCSAYPYLPGKSLGDGPVNDVTRFHAALRQMLGFEDVVELKGWNENEPAGLPTRENILRAFDRLVAASGKDDRVVVLLSGHGS